MNEPTAAPAEATVWSGRESCLTAWLEVIARSQRVLLIADHDGQDWPSDQPALIAALAGFLRRSPRAQVHILLADPSRLARGAAPRLRQLQRRHSATLLFRQMTEAPDRPQSVLLGDDAHAVQRPHAGVARGTLWLNHTERLAPTVQSWRNLWELATPSLPATLLGL